MENVISEIKEILPNFDPTKTKTLKKESKGKLGELVNELKKYLKHEPSELGDLLNILNKNLINSKIKQQIIDITNKLITCVEENMQLAKVVKKVIKIVKPKLQNPEQIDGTDNASNMQIVKAKPNVLNDEREGINGDNTQIVKVDTVKKRIIKKIIKVVKRHAPNNGEQSEISTSKDVTNVAKPNESNNLEQIEKALDAEVDAYNKFTEKNPMQGISWIEKLNTWQIKSDEYGINTRCTNLGKAAIIMINKFCSNSRKSKKSKKYMLITK
jgi:hypothetical protein